jgi:hypothetical protein
MRSLFVLTFLSFLCTCAWGEANRTGVGVILGNPTGIAAKRWLDKGHAVDGAAGFSWGKHTDFSIHSNYLLQSEGALYFNDTHPLDLYYGLGGRMEFADDIELGLRVPVGLARRFDGGASDIFVELAPVIDLIGRTGLELHFGFGARYYF